MVVLGKLEVLNRVVLVSELVVESLEYRRFSLCSDALQEALDPVAYTHFKNN